MTIDQKIAFLMLIVAALGLLAAALGKLYNWWSEQRSLHFEIDHPSSPSYIRAVQVLHRGKSRITAAAFWLHAKLYNNGRKPKLLRSLVTYYPSVAGKPPVQFLVSNATMGPDYVDVEGPTKFPITLAPSEGKELWILVEVEFPQIIGEILFELYGDCENEIAIREQMKHVEGETFEAISKRMKKYGYEVHGVLMNELTIHGRVLKKNAHSLAISPTLGELPFSATLDVTDVLLEQEEALPTQLKSVPPYYLVELHVDQKTKLVRRLKTGRDPLWFLHAA